MKKILLLCFTFVLVLSSLPVPAFADGDEDTALALATYFRSARAVISKNQANINDASKGDKGLSASAVVAEADKNYKAAAGQDVSAASGQKAALLKALQGAVSETMNEAQDLINEKGVGFKGFLPAVFAGQVASKFSSSQGGVAEIKLTAPKDYVRNRANRPDKWEEGVIEGKFKSGSHEKGKHISETTQKKGKDAFRLILPEYYGESCLSCHGDPKGELDITGGKKEGGKLGELGGAISVVIYK